MAIIRYVAHTKTFLQDRKLHLLVFPDEATQQSFYGSELESQCDITAVFLRNQLFEGIEDACKKYEKLDSGTSFFIPIVPRDFEKGQIVLSKGNMICEKCKENFAAHQTIPDALLDEINDYIAKSKSTLTDNS